MAKMHRAKGELYSEKGSYSWEPGMWESAEPCEEPKCCWKPSQPRAAQGNEITCVCTCAYTQCFKEHAGCEENGLKCGWRGQGQMAVGGLSDHSSMPGE